jgi:hypothetical protein
MIDIIAKTGKFSADCRCTKCGTLYSVKSIYDARKSPVGHLCVPCKTYISSMKSLSQEGLWEAFTYDELTGDLRHRYTTLSGVAGELATFGHSAGYLSVCIGRKHYLAHRVIYLMQTGLWPRHIDHINHDKRDNSWKNLRSVKQEENNRNMPKQTNTKTGVVGVNLHKPTGKYRAYITVAGKTKHLGLHETVAAAQAAREEANTLYGYHRNHGK